MKAYLLLPLLLIGVLFSSCKKETNNPVVITNKTVIKTVAPNQWSLVQDNGTYQAVLTVPEIDEYSQGVNSVQVAVSFNNGGLYEALPQVFGGVTYIYSYSIGKLYIDVQSADGTKPIQITQSMRVKIVIVESQE